MLEMSVGREMRPKDRQEGKPCELQNQTQGLVISGVCRAQAWGWFLTLVCWFLLDAVFTD